MTDRTSPAAAVAQMAERGARNSEVGGSIPARQLQDVHIITKRKGSSFILAGAPDGAPIRKLANAMRDYRTGGFPKSLVTIVRLAREGYIVLVKVYK